VASAVHVRNAVEFTESMVNEALQVTLIIVPNDVSVEFVTAFDMFRRGHRTAARHV
jgi:hypothetical protein